ncbi:hypothetical protein AKO1_014396 [Acrasis kona]|uniref:RPA-interacting protein C-terminal domain-containing protein n=1 Tax=Acrasis kona TaxID=1008807 RepID=A0AAW2Z0A2_9EUKA
MKRQRANFKHIEVDVKKKLMDKCFDRVKKNRKLILEKARQESIDHDEQVQDEELVKLWLTKVLQTEIEEFGEEISDEMQNRILDEMYAQVLSEEEQEALHDYQEYNDAELESILRTHADDYDEDMFVNIMCPCCQLNALMSTKHMLLCKCGLRIPTGNDGIGLTFVREQLTEACQEHKLYCGHVPEIKPDERFSSTFLTLSCQVCNKFNIIV